MKLLQPPVRPPVGVRLGVLVIDLFRMTEEMKTLVRQRVHRALLQVLKHEVLLTRVPALPAFCGWYARPVRVDEGRRHLHVYAGTDAVAAHQPVRSGSRRHRKIATAVQEVVLIQRQELDPFEVRGIEHRQLPANETDHVRHADFVDDPVGLRVQPDSRTSRGALPLSNPRKVYLNEK